MSLIPGKACLRLQPIPNPFSRWSPINLLSVLAPHTAFLHCRSPPGCIQTFLKFTGNGQKIAFGKFAKNACFRNLPKVTKNTYFGNLPKAGSAFQTPGWGLLRDGELHTASLCLRKPPGHAQKALHVAAKTGSAFWMWPECPWDPLDAGSAPEFSQIYLVGEERMDKEDLSSAQIACWVPPLPLVRGQHDLMVSLMTTVLPALVCQPIQQNGEQPQDSFVALLQCFSLLLMNRYTWGSQSIHRMQRTQVCEKVWHN